MSTRGSGIRHVIPPTYQAPATIAQANPVSGQKYTVLDTTKNVRVYSVSVSVTWTVQPTPLEVHFTIDGQAITHTFANPVSNTFYDAVLTASAIPTAQVLRITTDAVPQYRAFLYEGKSIKIEAETTGGTVQVLDCRVKYAKW